MHSVISQGLTTGHKTQTDQRSGERGEQGRPGPCVPFVCMCLCVVCVSLCVPRLLFLMTLAVGKTE